MQDCKPSMVNERLFVSFIPSFIQSGCLSCGCCPATQSSLYATSTFPIMHLICPLCFSFLLGITAIPREIENNACAKFWGQIRCIMGNVEVAYCPCRLRVGWWMPTQCPFQKDTGQCRQLCPCVSFFAF